MSERTITKLLLVISFVVLSGTALMPRTAFAENDAGMNVEMFEECLALAKQGDAEAQYRLGFMYRTGSGVPQDDKEAIKWILKAAEQGYAYAQTDLCLVYDTGKAGAPQDYKEAMKWWRKVAERGSVVAQFRLGQMYYLGLGVPQDYKEAVTWYRKAAEQGHAHAQSDLGFKYSLGLGVLQDYVESYAWYNISAAQGFKNASNGRDSAAKKLSSEALAKAQELSKEYYQKYVEPFQ